MDDNTRAEIIMDVTQNHMSDRASQLVMRLGQVGGELLLLLKEGFPESRETNLAIVKAEEALLWASNSILVNME